MAEISQIRVNGILYDVKDNISDYVNKNTTELENYTLTRDLAKVAKTNNYEDLDNLATINGNPIIGNLNIRSDAEYMHKQNTASKTWVINHRLNKFPSVMIAEGTNGYVIEGDILYISPNVIYINFSTPVKGTAYLN